MLIAASGIQYLENGQVVYEDVFSLHNNQEPGNEHGRLPLISCLMVTADRFRLARGAVECFRRQTYPNRELVIIDDGVDDGLQRYVEQLADCQIRLLRLPSAGATLGALRNQAVQQAQGDFVCQWDDDDLYDPARLEIQMKVLLAHRAQACFLSRWIVWWPLQHRLALSCPRLWEGSMLCAKALLPAYPELRQGEDTPVAE